MIDSADDPKKRKIGFYFLFPFFLLCLLAVFLWKALDLDPRQFNSARLEKKVPNFKIAYLENPSQFANEQIFNGKVSLLIVWSSWCITCQNEHPELLQIAQTMPELSLVGLNLHDTLIRAQHFLKYHGNPFHHVLFDKEGRLSIDLGVTGLPEVFLIDKKGQIRFRHEGGIDAAFWQMVLKPKIDYLLQEK